MWLQKVLEGSSKCEVKTRIPVPAMSLTGGRNHQSNSYTAGITIMTTFDLFNNPSVPKALCKMQCASYILMFMCILNIDNIDKSRISVIYKNTGLIIIIGNKSVTLL